MGSSRSLAANWAHVLRTCGAPAEIDVVSRWLVVTRACVQPMTLTAVAIAGVLAARSPSFTGWTFGLAAVGVVVAHAANNMMNDLFDTSSGLDTQSYPRALYAPHPVLANLVSRRTLTVAALVANVLDAAIMAMLAVVVGWPVLLFALCGVFISFFYVAPPLRLKARGLGEPGVFLVWGPLMIGGLYYSATGTITAELLWASIPYGLLVTAVLMGKHIDKMPWDARAGVRTLPVILGERRARTLTIALLVGFQVSIAALVIAAVFSLWTLVVVAALPHLVKTARVYRRPKPQRAPERYPVWPLWFVAWAFVHSRRAGALLVLGLLLALWAPLYL